MTMLSSLKALLFSSVAARGPAEDTGVSSLPLAGAMDFAKLFSGSMADAEQGAPVLASEGATAAVAEALPLTQTDAIDSVPTAEAPAIPAEEAKAQAGASAVWRDAASPLPPGLALGLVKHAAAMQASPSNGRAGAVADAVAPSEAPIESPMPMSEGVDAPAPAPEAATTPAVPMSKRADAVRKEGPVRRKAETADLPAEVESPLAEEKPSPVRADEQTDNDGELVAAAPALVSPMPLPVAMPAVESAPVPVPAQDNAPKAQAKGPAALTPAAPADRPSPEAHATSQPLPAGAAAPILRQAEAGGTQTPDGRQPGARAGSPKSSSGGAATVAGTDPLPATSEPLPAAEGAPAAPVLNGTPLKAEALALLQLVRDQVTARQSGAPVRVGEQVSAVAKPRSDRVAPIADAPAVPLAMPPEAAAQPVSSAPAQVVLPLATVPVVDLSASLGAQVVDMGVSGQWIDGLARDIAGLSANGAQGRFQLNSDQLGAVQVDIRQGSEGAAVNLTVASEAAEMALRQDSDRLKLDASLSSVRIAEVKIERSPVAETARPDSAGQQSSQQGSSQAQSAWANNSQNMGQPQGQQGRWQGRENNGFTPKSSGDPAVLNHEQAQQRGGESARARYA